MSLKVRKLAIQVADILDFGTVSGVSKLVAGSGISVSPASGIGAVTVANSGVTQVLAGTDITLAPASGLGTVTVNVDVSPSGLDGRYIKRSPSGENQAILPLTDVVPLTIQGFAGGFSNLLKVLDSAGTAVITVGGTGPTSGATTIAPSGLSGVPLILKPSATGNADALDIYDASSPQVLVWQVLSDGTLKGTPNTATQAIQIFAPTGMPALDILQPGDSAVRPRLRLVTSGATAAITFGPGGASSLDTRLIRTAATALQFDTAGLGTNLALAVLGSETISPSVSGVVLLTLTQPSGGTTNLFGATTTGQTGSVAIDYRNRFSAGTIAVSGGIFGTQVGKQFIASPHNIAPAILADRLTTLIYSDWNGYAADVVATHTWIDAAGNLNLGTLVGSTVIGFNFRPQLAGVNTVALFDSAQLGGVNATIGATTTARNFLHIVGTSGDGGPTTTKRGIYIDGLGGANPLTTAIGIDINPLPPATTAIGIRQSGTVETNQYAGMSRFGDNTTPVAFVDATGTAGTTMKAQGKNVLVRENLDEIQVSATVPGADTNLKTYALPANNYTNLVVEAEGYVSLTALSTVQDINIKVKVGGVQIGNTMVFRPASAAVSKVPFPIKASGASAAAATIAVTIGAAAADPNTTIFLNSLRIYGEV